MANDDHCILLVEDYGANILVATTMIESLGFRCEVAQDGFAALQKLEENEYSLILMDIQMQGIDGLETTRRIREIEKQRSSSATPIIAMTAHVTEEDRQKCLSAGMNDYLPKPFNPITFEKTLRNHINSKK